MKRKRFTSIVNVLAVLSTTLLFVSPASGEQTGVRGAAQEPLDGAKHQQVPRSELKALDATDLLPSAQVPIPGAPREQLSAEERRQLRSDINNAGRDIYRQGHPEPRRRF